MKLSEAREIARIQMLIEKGNLTKREEESLKRTYNLDDSLLYTKQSISGLYQEMEMSENFIDAHTDKSESKDIVSLHSHNFYEILYITSGSTQYIIGDTRYKIKKNDIIFLPPGISHQPLFLDEVIEPYERTVIWVNDNFLKKNIELLSIMETDIDTNIQIPHIIRSEGNQLNQFKQIISSLLIEKSSNLPGSSFSSVGIFIQLISQLYLFASYKDNEIPKAEDAAFIDDVVKYIETNFALSISLKSISDELNISESSVNNALNEQMNTSFYSLVTARRLIEAKKLILSETPLKQVPILCGYSDYSVFYKAFVKEFGISPSKFRSGSY